MKKNRGITLITLIITVVLLTIIGGVSAYYGINTYEESKVIRFETNMKILQKKVDLVLEEGKNYMELGLSLTDEQRQTLSNIISQDVNNYIETTDAASSKLRYFSSSEIQKDFDIDNINENVVINFENREVISLNGVSKNGTTHYVEKGLY